MVLRVNGIVLALLGEYTLSDSSCHAVRVINHFLYSQRNSPGV